MQPPSAVRIVFHRPRLCDWLSIPGAMRDLSYLPYYLLRIRFQHRDAAYRVSINFLNYAVTGLFNPVIPSESEFRNAERRRERNPEDAYRTMLIQGISSTAKISVVTSLVWHSRPRLCDWFPCRVQRGISTICRIACIEYDFGVETRHAASP
jgi:hypothetical protein